MVQITNKEMLTVIYLQTNSDNISAPPTLGVQ